MWKKRGNLNVKIEENLVRCKIGSMLEKPPESQLHCVTETPAGHYIFHCSNLQNTICSFTL